ncbi:hypothetical protein WJX79_008793 [Trebouxia sp. C0005]
MGMVGYCPSLCEYKVGKVIEGVKALQQLLPETVKTVAAFEIRHPPTFAGVEEGMMSQPSSHLLPNLDPGGRQTLILCAPPAVRCKADSLCYLEERVTIHDQSLPQQASCWQLAKCNLSYCCLPTKRY